MSCMCQGTTHSTNVEGGMYLAESYDDNRLVALFFETAHQKITIKKEGTTKAARYVLR